MSSSEEKPPVPGGERVPRLSRASIVGAVSSGILGILSFPIFGKPYNLDLLIFLMLCPLMLAAQGAGKKRGLLLGSLCGMTFVMVSFTWVGHAISEFTSLGTILSLVLYLLWVCYEAVPWAILGLALGRCRSTPQILLVLPLWIGLEHYYPRLWPWHLGGALYDRSWFLQCVDVLGASGLTALVFLTSATVAGLVRWRGRGEGFPRWRVAASMGLLLACCVYGPMRLVSLKHMEQGRAADKLTVGFVQGFLNPMERRQSGLQTYIAETRELLELSPQVDLVLWPEGVDWIPLDLGPGADPWRLHPENAEKTGKFMRDEFKLPMVFGGAGVILAPGTQETPEIDESYNIAVYLSPGGSGGIYRKNHPVPFGESVPGWDLLPESWRRAFPAIGNLSLGDDNPPMTLGESTFRNLICYEAVLPEYVRQSAIGSDFLVNITEDYWYGNTAHIPQHLSVLILRAVESRIPVLRCTNVGPSGIVDISGRFIARGNDWWKADRFALEFVPGRAVSFYSNWGHWFPLLSLLLGVLLLYSSRGKPVAESTSAQEGTEIC